MTLLYDDPVTEIDFVPRGARILFDEGTNFEGVFDPGLKSCNLEFGVLPHFLQFYVGR